MTVNQASNKITYTANGSTTQWNFAFSFVDATDFQVFITDPTGVITQLASTAFTVVGNPVIAPNPTPTGGFILYPISGTPLAAGNLLTIIRILPEVQPDSISNQSIVYPPVVEAEFDYLTMVDQQLDERISRAIIAAPSDPPMLPLPPAAFRANQQAVFDANGNLIAGGAVIGTVISPPMVPVVTAPTLPAARTAMGVPGIDSPTFTGVPKAPTPVFGDNSTDIATTAYVQAALAANGLVLTTGDLKPTHKTVADPGFIFWVNGTIGDPTSGASIRQNADTQNLFTLYYNGYSDTVCPLLTNTGAATTRAAQGTAAAAFAAHCQMSLPKGSQRGVGVAGSSDATLTARTLGSVFGVEKVVQTVPQMPLHGHSAATSGPHSHGHTWNAGQATAPLGQYDPNQNWTASGINGLGGADFTLQATDIGITVFQTGGNQPMNVMNPMAYVAWMIKL